MIFSSKIHIIISVGDWNIAPVDFGLKRKGQRDIPEITPWSMSQLRKAQAQEKIAPLNQLPR